MFRYIIILISILVLTQVDVFAETRKELKDLKSYIKASNISKGREIIDRCLKDTTINNDPEFYALAYALEKKANDSENMKLYLNQKYDTAAFFNSVYNIFEYVSRQEQTLAKKDEKLAAKTRKQRHDILITYYPNLYNGGVYFVKKQNWKSADKFICKYITAAKSDIFKDDNLWDEEKMARAAFLSLRSCYQGKDYKNVFRYKNLAESDSANIEYTIQYETLAYEQLNQTDKYLKMLKRGMASTSSPEFYFSRLTDYYNKTKDYMASYKLNDSLLSQHPDNALYLYAQTIATYNMQKNDECVENAAKLFKVDTTHVDAYYFAGLCYYNRGLEESKKVIPSFEVEAYKSSLDDVNKYFTKAMPYLERYRRERPNEKEKWWQPLYKIYFLLNESDKLRDLEKQK